MSELKSLHVVVTLASGKEYVSTTFDTPDEQVALETLVRRAAIDALQVMSFKARNGSWVLIPGDALKNTTFELVSTYATVAAEPVFPAPGRGY